MNNLYFKEIFQALERATKSGNIHAVIRTDDDIDGAVESEVIIDYKYDLKAPVLKVIRNGKPTFLYTESDRLFREFIENVFQLGTASDGNGYSPSIYFKLHEDAQGNTGFNKETVTAFYNEFKDNAELKPYLKHVKKDGDEVHKVYPFMDTNHVYFDISELFSGVQDVKDVSAVLLELVAEIGRMTNKFTEVTDAINTELATMRSDFGEVDAEQDELLELMNQANNTNKDTLAKIVSDINNLIANTEKAIRPLPFNLTHDAGDTVIPVMFEINGGRETGKVGIIEQFMSSLYIASDDFNVVAKIGDEVMWSGGEFSTTKAHDWIINKVTADKLCIYDVRQADNNKFVVFMRTGNYLIFNKYIEDLIITPMPEGWEGETMQVPTRVFNSYINGPDYINIPYCHRFTNGLFITKELGFASGIKMIVR